jgi:hypothetical protein
MVPELSWRVGSAVAQKNVGGAPVFCEGTRRSPRGISGRPERLETFGRCSRQNHGILGM